MTMILQSILQRAKWTFLCYILCEPVSEVNALGKLLQVSE